MPSSDGSLARLPITAFKLYAKPEYLRDITARIAATVKGDRVSLTTLSFTPADMLIAPLLEALYAAAKRGVNVLLLVDAYNFLVTIGASSTTPGPLFFRRELREVSRSSHPVIQALRRIESAGGRTAITNFPRQLFTNPFAGRSHIKMTIINDRVYLGGCNLDTSTELDIMTGWDDSITADWLQTISEQTYRAKHTREVFDHSDIDETLDNHSRILIDSGKPRQSIIYRTALQMIDDARESVFITCQYFPNHITAHHLSLAHERGVAVTIVYNHPGKDTWPFNIIHRSVVRFERTRRPYKFFAHELPKGTPFLHAKVLATESQAMLGSHNYVRAGVNWGTAEIALLRRDPRFAKALIAKTMSVIKRSPDGDLVAS